MGGSTVTAPAGFTTLVDGYWKGTQRSWVFSGPWSGDLTVTADQPLEFGYAAVALRGAASVTAGMVKDRETEPVESTTVTAPAVEHGTNDIAIGIAFERTSAVENPEQVTVNDGWTIEHYTAQGTNFQTTLIGVGGTGDMVATYPNAQATNGFGVQVVAHAAPAPSGTAIDSFLAARPFYTAHRLGGTEYPEHTIQGMNAAINAGFTAFEFSTYQTRDGVFIGSHDWTTERTTGQYHEIWDTDWSTIQTLDQQAGPIIRLEDAVAAMPEDSVLVLDHKATSNRAGTPPAGDLASETALFDLLETLFDNPTERVIWKVFVNASSAERARARGYQVMCMLYPSEVPSADFTRWDILGMEYNAPQEIWDTLLATGKPTIAHVIVNSTQAATGLSRGAHGLMSSVPSVVAPHA